MLREICSCLGPQLAPVLVKERYGPARELSEGLYIDVAELEKLVFPLDRRDLVRS